jgi:hypothetical protein
MDYQNIACEIAEVFRRGLENHLAYLRRCRVCSGDQQREKESMFFFEKKNQKTFATFGAY